MSAEDPSAGATDTSEETAPQVDAEQQTAQPGSLSALIMEQAKAEGAEIGDSKPLTVAPVEEPQPEEPTAGELGGTAEEPTIEEPPEGQSEEEKPAEEKRLVPLREVMEERAKKERANERAKKIETEYLELQTRTQQLEQQVIALSGPQPTKDDLVADVNDTARLDVLQKHFRRFLRETEDVKPVLNEDGENIYEGMLVGINADGTPRRANLTEEAFRNARIDARNALDEHIPDRRNLLLQRFAEDQKVMAEYPEILKDPELQQTFAWVANEILSGRAAKSPLLSRYVVIASKAILQEQQSNGSKTPVKDDNSKKILKAVQQPVAPTPTRTRAIPVRGSGAALADAKARLEKTGSAEDAESLIALKLFGKGASAEILEPIGE